jgi:hypothetical protein
MRSHSGTDHRGDGQQNARFAIAPAVSFDVLKVHLVFFAAAGVTVLGFAVGTIGSTAGRVALGIVCLGLAAIDVALWRTTIARRSRELVIDERDGELWAPGSRLVASMFLIALVSTIAYPIAFLVGILRGELTTGSAAAFAMSLLVAVICLPVLIMVAMGMYRLNGLVLTRDAITYRGYRREWSANWAELDRVEITPEPRVAIRVSGADAEIRVPAGLMASGPVPLAEYVDDLLRNPDRRPSKLPSN